MPELIWVVFWQPKVGPLRISSRESFTEARDVAMWLAELNVYDVTGPHPMLRCPVAPGCLECL